MSAAARILAVDDEAAIRRFLRSGLVAQGYEVLEAETGEAAVNAATGEKPDLVVLDLGLPDIDGLEVLRRIRRVSPVPVIVLSVRSDEKGKVEAFDLGADDYVTKPFGMEELTARVRTALRHRLQEQGAAPVFRTGDLAVDLVRRIVAAGCRLLHPGGWLVLEVGGTQDGDLARPLAIAGFARPDPWWDEHGDLRGLATQMSGSAGRRP